MFSSSPCVASTPLIAGHNTASPCEGFWPSQFPSEEASNSETGEASLARNSASAPGLWGQRRAEVVTAASALVHVETGRKKRNPTINILVICGGSCRSFEVYSNTAFQPQSHGGKPILNGPCAHGELDSISLTCSCVEGEKTLPR
ncbi:hypothetical protein EYF80_012748 [Liparis tanakae]|uniref:Uncharacterized protein n=1 Tax=Liparis tanakae TaxID=230148 RepID=A0A4Z2IGN3_9TELE|nr:hypothetical protein EYF80_012748 [Liparis tanakae]